MKKGIELPKQTIDALLNSASMFIEPIVHPCDYYSSKNQQSIRIEPENDRWDKDRNYCIREEGGGWQDFTKEDFLKYVNAPLQVGDEFFIQEEIIDFLHFGGGEDVTPASQMQEPQSRYKGVVIDVEIKRVGDMLMSDIGKCGLEEEFILDEFPYDNNTFVFLYTVKRINS